MKIRREQLERYLTEFAAGSTIREIAARNALSEVTLGRRLRAHPQFGALKRAKQRQQQIVRSAAVAVRCARCKQLQLRSAYTPGRRWCKRCVADYYYHRRTEPRKKNRRRKYESV